MEFLYRLSIKAGTIDRSRKKEALRSGSNYCRENMVMAYHWVLAARRKRHRFVRKFLLVSSREIRARFTLVPTTNLRLATILNICVLLDNPPVV